MDLEEWIWKKNSCLD